LDLVKEHDIRPEDINEVQVITSRYSHGLIGSPFEIRDNPQVDAQFSGSYTVAAAIIRRKFGIAEIQEDSIRNPQILSLAKRVKCTPDDSIKTSLAPVTVRFDLGDGSSVSKRVDVLKGNPANPTTEEEDIEKFNDCVKFGVKRMSDEKRDTLVQLIFNLESVNDVGEIVEYLA
jgi:2-methylcitrate dehydratase PrpD